METDFYPNRNITNQDRLAIQFAVAYKNLEKAKEAARDANDKLHCAKDAFNQLKTKLFEA